MGLLNHIHTENPILCLALHSWNAVINICHWRSWFLVCHCSLEDQDYAPLSFQ
jgi:hypothetical protein